MIEIKVFTRASDNVVMVQASKLKADETAEAIKVCLNKFRELRPINFNPTVRIKIHDAGYGDVLVDGFVMITG